MILSLSHEYFCEVIFYFNKQLTNEFSVNYFHITTQPNVCNSTYSALHYYWHPLAMIIKKGFRKTTPFGEDAM